VSALLGGVALAGGSTLLAACEREASRSRAGADTAANAATRIGDFTMADVAFLDEVADTILPDTPKSPGAKAARVGAFMALMVTDGYRPAHQKVFREGMGAIDAASRAAHGVPFTAAAPAQRLAVLEALDREQHAEMRRRDRAEKARARRRPPSAARLGADTGARGARSDAYLPDQRQEQAGTQDVASAAAATDEQEKPPPHYFRMVKELALLGYFTSEIGCTKAQRYVETPGRYDPCAPFAPGDPAWAPHA
jgi:hypothetical protein